VCVTLLVLYLFRYKHIVKTLDFQNEVTQIHCRTLNSLVVDFCLDITKFICLKLQKVKSRFNYSGYVLYIVYILSSIL